MRLIGLTGPAGCGKDTLADHLCTEHGFARYAFAEPLKRMLRAIGVDADTRATKELPHALFGASPRRMAQTLGTDWMREMIVSDGWLRLAAQFVDVAGSNVVITDCRFENEAAFIRARGGVIWHVERPGTRAVEAHKSEAGVEREPGEPVLWNSGTIAQLQHYADELL